MRLLESAVRAACRVHRHEFVGAIDSPQLLTAHMESTQHRRLRLGVGVVFSLYNAWI